MTAPLTTLRDLRNALRPDAPEPIVAALEAVLAGEADSLDRALGLRSHGGVPLHRAARLDRRNNLIRRLWQSVPDWSAMSSSAASRLMAQSARRYEANRWPRECDALSAPLADPAATWWRILKLEVPIPDSRQLQRILDADIQEGV